MTSTAPMPSSSPMRIIAGPDDVAEGVAWLRSECPKMAAALDRVGPLPLRRRDDGFGALLSAIVGQQVSIASAAAINARLAEAGLVTEAAIRASAETDLKACGLSRQKMRYARALAEAGIDWTALRAMPTDEVVATLTAVPGIGAWTAEIYAMFSLGHADVFAPGDLALQEGARMVYGLDERPKERALRDWSADWSPWRSVAARLFWAYYAREKRREGIA